MSRKAAVPDAWDDDWEVQADEVERCIADEGPNKNIPISRAERRAQHERNNKKLWESADSTERFHFLETRGDVPLKTDFKPSIKVLSRKPVRRVPKDDDGVNGMSHLALEDDDDEEEEARKKKVLSPEEQRLKSERDREEKRKKYEEARERLFGSQATSSGTSTPGNLTPPPGGSPGRGRGRGRDGRDAFAPRTKKGLNDLPTEKLAEGKRLYDPNYTVKADSTFVQKRTICETSSSGRSTPNEEQQPVRQPKGPDGNGMRGFGFASRGNKAP